MKIIDSPIQKSSLNDMLPSFFDDMIKAVVDIQQEIIGIDAELHADIEKQLLSSGSVQDDLWGINLYPDQTGEDFIEFDSLINIRPYQDNRGRYVYDPETRSKIIEVVNKLIQ